MRRYIGTSSSTLVCCCRRLPHIRQASSSSLLGCSSTKSGFRRNPLTRWPCSPFLKIISLASTIDRKVVDIRLILNSMFNYPHQQRCRSLCSKGKSCMGSIDRYQEGDRSEGPTGSWFKRWMPRKESRCSPTFSASARSLLLQYVHITFIIQSENSDC